MEKQPEFAITEDPSDGPELRLSVAGELDLATVPELRQRLDAAATEGVRRILVDLSAVSFIDSLSLAALVATKRRLGPGGRLAIVAGHPYVLLIFEAGGLDSVLDVFPTLSAAEEHLRD